jgi:hypothetical protein
VMVFKKVPLKELVVRNKPNSQGGAFGWPEFIAIAEMPKDERPSNWSLHKIFGKSNNTIKAWLRRWDEGERK